MPRTFLRLRAAVVAFRALPFLVALLLVAGCGGDGSSGPTGPGELSGPMTARIDGDAFVAEFATAGRAGGQVFVNGAGQPQRAIGFTFPDLGVGTYTVEPGATVSAGVTLGSANWIAGGATGSGTIVVTSLDGGRIVGTFVLSVEGGGPPATLSITEGTFDVPL